jgi:DNA-binding CsgD family transcriptional regulator
MPLRKHGEYTLTQKQLTTLRLAQQGLTARQIADISGVHRSTIDKRLRRARQLLESQVIAEGQRHAG